MAASTWTVMGLLGLLTAGVVRSHCAVRYAPATAALRARSARVRACAPGAAASTAAPRALVGQTVDLEIESLTSLGEGVARLEGGLVVLVPFVIPGERVRARIHRQTSSYAAADLVSVEAAAAERLQPRCELFGQCGGCQYQHMPLRLQREWKRQHVIDAFARIGGYPQHGDEPTADGVTAAHSAPAPPAPAPLESLVAPTMGAGEEHAYGYRSKLTPHHDGPRRRRRDPRRAGADDVAAHGAAPAEAEAEAAAEAEVEDIGPIGFRMAGRRRLVDVPRCPIASEPINAALPAVRAAARAAAAEKAAAVRAARAAGERRKPPKGATLLLRDADGGVETDPRVRVRATVEGIQFEFLAGEFFQNNPSALPPLVRHVVARARAGGAARSLIDAYCGGGFFALCAAGHFETVAGVEVSADNVEAARANAARNGIANARFEAGPVEDLFSPLARGADGAYAGAHTAVVLDPPRKGCSEEFLEQLFALRPLRVVYVSCDPATQARDARLFAAAGYVLREAMPFDLFPQTRHIECVATFDAWPPPADPDGEGVAAEEASLALCPLDPPASG